MRDVIVIGGGPAGSTVSTLLARQGFSVTVLERERFPRFQIGESLLPYNNDLFARLGVLDRLETLPHVPKYGAYFVTGDGQVGYSFRFDQRLNDPYRRSLQVKRAEFDQLMLENAERQGAHIRYETTVAGVDLSHPERAIVRTSSDEELEARFVVDASGHGAIVGNTVGRRSEVKSLRKIAFFAHYRNVPRAEGKDGGSTVIVVLRNAWFWMIPVSPEVMSIGLVVEREHFVSSGLGAQEMLERTIAATPWIAERMKDAERVTQIHARKDFSFRMSRIAGPNFALVGDSAGFLDPIFSTGVFLAMKAGDLAASAIAERLRSGSTQALDGYARTVNRGLDEYLRFIERFYDREFLEVFLQPSERWGLLDAVVRVLAGDVFTNHHQRFRLALFFFLVKMQKWRGGIAPRIDWDKIPSAAVAG